MHIDQREVKQNDSAPKALTYRELLEKTIREEWGPQASIQDMSPGSSPYSTEMYSLEKKWRIQRSEMANPSEYLCTGGVQPHVAFERDINKSLRFMASFMDNPKSFSDQELESARDAIIDIKRRADSVNLAGGWGYNPSEKNRIINQNSAALEKKKKTVPSDQFNASAEDLNYGRSDECGSSAPSFK